MTTPTPQPLDLDAIRARADEWQDQLDSARMTQPEKDKREGTVSALRRSVAEVEAVRAERDKLAAIIERAKAEMPNIPYGSSDTGAVYLEEDVDYVRNILSAAPSDALAEVKREAWDEGVNAANEWWENLSGSLVNPYAAIREGRS